MNDMNKLAIAVILGSTGTFGPQASAQTFLERLEQTVRENTKQTQQPADAQSPSLNIGELPPPPSKEKKAKSLSAPTTNGQIPAGTVVVPPPASIVESTAPEVVNDPGYLGLEAESLSGGGIGAKIVAVTENSPAWKAGFSVGDVVQGINGFAIANLDGMVDQLARRSAGESVKFLVTRGGKNIELTAVLQNAALAGRINGPLPVGPATSMISPNANAPGWLGLVVVDLSMAFRQQFGTSAYRGAAVTRVMPGSPADIAGIKPGDAVVQLDGASIETARELSSWVARSRPGQLAEILVYRGNTPRRVQLVIGIDPAVGAMHSASFGASTSLHDLQSQVSELREDLRKTREQMSRIEQRLNELLDRQ